MAEFQLFALAILIFCSIILALSFVVPHIKTFTSKPEKTRKKPAKTHSKNQQIIAEAVNILNVEITKLTEVADHILNNIDKL